MDCLNGCLDRCRNNSKEFQTIPNDIITSTPITLVHSPRSSAQCLIHPPDTRITNPLIPPPAIRIHQHPSASIRIAAMHNTHQTQATAKSRPTAQRTQKTTHPDRVITAEKHSCLIGQNGKPQNLSTFGKVCGLELGFRSIPLPGTTAPNQPNLNPESHSLTPRAKPSRST